MHVGEDILLNGVKIDKDLKAAISNFDESNYE